MKNLSLIIQNEKHLTEKVFVDKENAYNNNKSKYSVILIICAGTATSDLKILCAQKIIEKVCPSHSKKSDFFIWLEK